MGLDPFDLQRKLTEQWEKIVSELVEKRLQDPDVWKWLQRSMDFTQQIRQTMESQFQEALKAARLPTTSDLAVLGDRLASLEEKLERLEGECKAQAAAAAKSSAAARTGRKTAGPRRAKARGRSR